MPYFLVTHTRLIEADNEKHAAQKVYEKIRNNVELTFRVKSDELTVSQMIISNDLATD